MYDDVPLCSLKLFSPLKFFQRSLCQASTCWLHPVVLVISSRLHYKDWNSAQFLISTQVVPSGTFVQLALQSPTTKNSRSIKQWLLKRVLILSSTNSKRMLKPKYLHLDAPLFQLMRLNKKDWSTAFLSSLFVLTSLASSDLLRAFKKERDPCHFTFNIVIGKECVVQQWRKLHPSSNCFLAWKIMAAESVVG